MKNLTKAELISLSNNIKTSLYYVFNFDLMGLSFNPKIDENSIKGIFKRNFFKVNKEDIEFIKKYLIADLLSNINILIENANKSLIVNLERIKKLPNPNGLAEAKEFFHKKRILEIEDERKEVKKIITYIESNF